MAKFLTKLNVSCHTTDDNLFRVDAPLVYESDILGQTITVPVGFWNDLASVPRMPIIYLFFGHRSHYEGVIHDYLYRIDAGCSLMDANRVFLEAMEARGKNQVIRYGMFAGVVLGGWAFYHKRMIDWVPSDEPKGTDGVTVCDNK